MINYYSSDEKIMKLVHPCRCNKCENPCKFGSGAFIKGEINLIKPNSCHLYPVRVKNYSSFTAVNYHHWNICSEACELGEKLKKPIYEFVKDALIRRFGKSWYLELEKVSKELKKV